MTSNASRVAPADGQASDGLHESDDRMFMLRMVNAYRLGQMLSAVATLGVAELLEDGPQRVESLAKATGTQPGPLRRVLRAVASVGFFSQRPDGAFESTAMGGVLSGNATVSLRHATAMIGAPWHWDTWTDLMGTIRTGKPAFETAKGDFQTYLDSHDEARRVFDAAAADLGALADASILVVYDFEACSHLVDIAIGGGDGSFVAKVLARHSSLGATLCDLPRVVPLAARRLARDGVDDRCRLLSWRPGQPPPPGGDLYVLRNVLRDLGDREAVELLGHCAAVLPPDGRLLVMEMVVPAGNEPSLGKLIDIDALLFTAAGRERTLEEYQSLLRAAGLDIGRIIPTPGPISILECAPGGPGQRAGRPSGSLAAGAAEISDRMPPHLKVVRMLGGFRVSRMLSVACQLDLADRVGDDGMEAIELAQATGCHARSLYRLMRALAGFGIFAENGKGSFEVTARARYLQRGYPGSIYRAARVLGAAWHWQMWGRLLDTMRDGVPAFDRVLGDSYERYCARSPELTNEINESKAAIYSPSDEALVRAYDFRDAGLLAEVGGGFLALRLLAIYPQLYAILIDRPVAVEGLRRAAIAAGLTDRVEIVAQDIFDEIPAADTLLLRGVIHYWDDDDAVRILQGCRRSLASGGRLLLAEMLMPPDNGPFVGKLIDVESLLLTQGGRERSRRELVALLDAAGFRVEAVLSTEAPISLIVARPIGER